MDFIVKINRNSGEGNQLATTIFDSTVTDNLINTDTTEKQVN